MHSVVYVVAGRIFNCQICFFFENVVCSIGFWIEAFGLLLPIRLSISKVDHVGLMGPLSWVKSGFACQFD
jgi:hypothetical protein